MKSNKKAQFFIMSIVLLALAMFMLMAYFLTIDESGIMFESSSRIVLKNIKNAVEDNGNCNGNFSLCPHFEQIYSGKFKLSCSEIGGTAPYNYTISIISKDLDFSGDFTQNLACS